jgi:TonB family protein
VTGPRVALEVITFGSQGLLGSKMLTSPSISIGRDPEAAIHLDDPSVSLKHAVVFAVGDAYFIKDLGSRTGTWVNGAPASALDALDPADEITIGAFRLRVTIHKAHAGPRVPPPVLDGLMSPTPFGQFAPPAASASRESGELPTAVREAPDVARELGPGGARDEVPPQGAPATASDVDEMLALAGVLDERLADAAEPDTGRLPPERPVMKTVPLAWTAESLVRPPIASPPPITSPPTAPSFSYPPAPAQTPVAIKAAAIASPHVVERTAAPVPAPAPAPAAPAAQASVPPHAGRPIVDDDDEDDDSDFVPPFDLLESLAARALRADDPRRSDAVLETVRYRRGRVLSVRHLTADSALRLGSEVIVSRQADKSFALYPKAVRAFVVRQGGRDLSAHEAQLLVGMDGTIGLAPGMQITIDVWGEDKLLVQLVPPAPKLARPRMSLGIDKHRWASGASSSMFHIAVIAFVGIFALDKQHDAPDINEGRFATIALKEIELEPPPPPPEPPPPEVAPTVAPAPAPGPRTPAPRTASRTKSKAAPLARSAPTNAKAAEAAPEQPSPSTAKILSSLGSAAPSGMTATALTNLDAAPHAAGGFKVSGAIGKAPSDTLRIAGAGSGEGQLDTKSATEVGTKVGRVEGRSTPGVVRARVTAIPQSIGGEGHLDRGEIQKVVNAHVHQVQGCYERQLMKDPSLAGKITLEWVIDGSGGVASVRVRQSTVHSAEVASCIQGAIQRWKFRAPQGGSVTVTYPFAFSTLGN